MRAQRSYQWIAILMAFMMAVHAKAQQADSLLSTRIISSFGKITAAPSEKVYLHTDKPYYFAGDSIWMEAYLVNAVTHQSITQSKYVYVELVNRKDVVIQRRKFEKHGDGTIPGFIPLPDNMEEGDYYLRAYTHWMMNGDEDFFYHQNIKVYKKESTDVNMTIRYEQNGNKRTAIVTIRKGGEPFKHKYVDYMVRTKATGNAFIQQQTNGNGEIRINIPPKKEMEQYIYVVMEDQQGARHRKTFFVPDEYDFYLDFFPEGGNLIAGTTQKIAFQALGSDGHSVPVDGAIINTQGDTLTRFNSLHGGIGTFMLSVSKDEQYKAIATTRDHSLKKEFTLPQATELGYALAVTTRKDKAYYQILHAPNTTPDKTFYLLGHIRGIILFINKVKQEQGVVSLAGIPDGIVTLTLLDDTMVPYSERLLFVCNAKPQGEMTNKSNDFSARKPVELDFSLLDSRHRPLQGLFSVSITDSHAVNIDSTANNILSHLLLTSDLQGHIESPGYYFTENGIRNQTYLDNLMLTHGWRRFRTEEVLKDRLLHPKYYIEAGQAISGKVMTGTNKPSVNSPVLVKIGNKTYPPVQTDKAGAFILDNISYQDTVFVEAYTPEKGKLLRSSIHLDKDEFLPPKNNHPYQDMPISEGIEEVLNPKSLGEGMWELTLPELTVVAHALVKERFSSYKMNDEEMVRQQNAKTALDLVQKVPGFQIINNRPYLNPKQSLRPEMRMSTDVNNREILRPTGKIDYGKTVRFVLDNKSVPFNALSMINADDIVSVHKIDPEVDAALDYAQNHAAIEEAYLEALENGATLEELDELEFDQQIRNFKDGDFRTSGGCIILASRKGNMRIPKSDSRGDEAFLLGLSQYKDFYAPKYTTSDTRNSLPDKRTTIHWQYKLDVDDMGQAKVKFYTADRPSNYDVIIEGISAEGTPCHFQWRIINEK